MDRLRRAVVATSWESLSQPSEEEKLREREFEQQALIFLYDFRHIEIV